MIDYHVHLWPHRELADETDLAVERVAQFVEQAAARGVEEVALTEHLFRFSAGRAVVEGWWRDFPGGKDGEFFVQAERYFDHHATADLDRYVETASAAKAAGLPVVIGLEVDYYPGRMDDVARLLAGYPFDVLLGSIHWIGNWMFDDLNNDVQMSEWERRSHADAWRAYGDALAELAGTGTCDVLAHPDLVKVANHVPDRGVVDEVEEQIAEAAASSGMAAEISSAGFVKPCRTAYPSRTLLERFAAKGVPVTLASDTHGTDRVGDRNAELVEMAARAGYESVRGFERRDARDRPLVTAAVPSDHEARRV